MVVIYLAFTSSYLVVVSVDNIFPVEYLINGRKSGKNNIDKAN
jgi:hypothetical protein